MLTNPLALHKPTQVSFDSKLVVSSPKTPSMESAKLAEAWPEFSSMEELKSSKREIQAQHATLGVLISVLEARISALESELKDHEFLLRKPDAITTINLTVVGPGGSRSVIRMKRRWVLRELMSACCGCWNEEVANIVFLFKGRLLSGDQTPLQLEMEDGDEIVAEKRWI